jgi:hypothetical protein
MAVQEWSRGLETVIKQHRTGADLARFRNAFRAEVDSAKSSGELSQDGADLLLRARGYIESWVADSSPEATHSWEELQHLARDASHQLPSSLLRTILSRFPRIPMDEASRIEALLGNDRLWLEFLVSRGIVVKRDIETVGKKFPEALYEGVGLDVIVQAGMPVPRAVWGSLGNGQRRPPQLASAEHVFAIAIAKDRGKDAVAWTAAFLGTNERLRRNLLIALLQQREFIVRLSRELALGSTGRRVAKAADLTKVVDELVRLCTSSDNDVRPPLDVGASILGLFSIALLTDSGSVVARSSPETKALVALGAEQLAGEALRRVEGGDRRGADATPVVLTVDALYRAVHAYLQDLPTAIDDAMLAPERSARLARYEGQRDLLMSLIDALEAVSDSGPMRDSVEVLLFNAGVRKFGAIGEKVAADLTLHEPTMAGLEPGAPAAVVRPGYRWGLDGGVVLVRARIEPVDTDHEGRPNVSA